MKMVAISRVIDEMLACVSGKQVILFTGVYPSHIDKDMPIRKRQRFMVNNMCRHGRIANDQTGIGPR
jgi:hypothetical protein